jgi:hypothetical protein
MSICSVTYVSGETAERFRNLLRQTLPKSPPESSGIYLAGCTDTGLTIVATWDEAAECADFIESMLKPVIANRDAPQPRATPDDPDADLVALINRHLDMAGLPADARTLADIEELWQASPRLPDL